MLVPDWCVHMDMPQQVANCSRCKHPDGTDPGPGRPRQAREPKASSQARQVQVIVSTVGTVKTRPAIKWDPYHDKSIRHAAPMSTDNLRLLGSVRYRDVVTAVNTLLHLAQIEVGPGQLKHVDLRQLVSFLERRQIGLVEFSFR